MDKQSENSIRDQYSQMRPDEQNKYIGGIAGIVKRATDVFKIVKDEWAHDHDGGDKETVNIGSLEAGEISLSKGTEGKYVVTDPKKYGALLHDCGFTIPGGQPAAEQAWMPRQEAMDQQYIEDMVADHGGELPDGVEYKAGQPATVTFRAAKGFVDKMFSTELAAETMRMLLTATPEKGEDK